MTQFITLAESMLPNGLKLCSFMEASTSIGSMLVKTHSSILAESMRKKVLISVKLIFMSFASQKPFDEI